MDYEQIMGAPLWQDVVLLIMVGFCICLWVFANPFKK